MPRRSRIASASSGVEASGSVGPEAISEASSPGTSEISQVSTRAGWAAAARRPPLIADKWRRTVLISPIGAPLLSSALLMACFSARLTPGAGRVISAEPPPEIRVMTRSSSPRPSTASSMRRAAFSLRSSGIGCEASRISMRRPAAPSPDGPESGAWGPCP